MTTIHCSSAHAIPTRLVELGVDRANIYASDELYIAAAQVLVPLLCPHCKLDRDAALAHGRITADDYAELSEAFESHFFIAGAGCEACKGRGVKGRTVVSEVIRTDAAYLDILGNHGIAAARRFSLSRGELSIATAAKRKVLAGLVSAYDVSRVVDLAELTPSAPAISAIAA